MLAVTQKSETAFKFGEGVSEATDNRPTSRLWYDATQSTLWIWTQSAGISGFSTLTNSASNPWPVTLCMACSWSVHFYHCESHARHLAPKSVFMLTWGMGYGQCLLISRFKDLHTDWNIRKFCLDPSTYWGHRSRNFGTNLISSDVWKIMHILNDDPILWKQKGSLLDAIKLSNHPVLLHGRSNHYLQKIDCYKID